MSSLPVIRLPFVSYPEEGLLCPEPTLTQQNFADECDFNNVLAKWQSSGLITHINSASPQYGDVSDIGDYQAAMDTVLKAQASFDALPAAVRERFANDPSQLLRFVQDPENTAEAIRLGLVVDNSAGSPSIAQADVIHNPTSGGVNG